MARYDTEDAVFDHAVAAALDLVQYQQMAYLRDVVEVGRHWAVAQARTEEALYIERARRVSRWPAGWAGRWPMLWRWAFVLVMPAITWLLVPWSLRVDLATAGKLAVLVLSVSLVLVLVSYTGRLGRIIGRSWVLVSLVLPILMSVDALVELRGWSGAGVLILVVAGFSAASVLKIAMAAALPTSAVLAEIDAADQALEDWRSAMLTEGVVPVLRAEMRSRQIVRGTELRYLNTEGLQRGGSLIMHQPVSAGRKLAALVSGLNGGSFALAGPRGAGKTSLLQAFGQGAYREPKQPLDLMIMVAAPVDYVPREFVVHLYAQTCRAVLSHVDDISPRAVKAAKRRDRWWRPWPDDTVRLSRAALRGLEDIAFVRTRSGETSGKIGFSGAEISFKRGISAAGRPATFPELVEDFRGFVRLAASTLAPTRVVIAIDEMDRIDAGESARKFLNEIKAIFDVPGCYYLMSVSTEAQHDFELAGVGLRSVFDSSFDEVVRVDYLDFELARGLISRSAEGLPDPFIALAYVFSGGLARQLTRSARAIVRQEQRTKLTEVVGELIADELDRVCKTTGDALTSVDGQEGVDLLLRVLADPHDELRAYRKAIQNAYDGDEVAIRNLRDLAAARIEFLAVVRDYFTDDLAEVVPAQVNALARARRYAGSNPATGLALLEEFSAATPERPAPEQPPQ